VTATTDQRGVVHEYLYDSAGRPIADMVTDLGSSGDVDDAVLRIDRAYDDVGRLKSTCVR
jgi:YD repeat-containing protein